VLRSAALFGAVLLGALTASAQTPAVIATDRPSVTDSSAVVPQWEFQAENGLLETGNQEGRTIDFTETQLRFGIGPSTELRFTAPDYYQGSPSGFGDVAAGVKQQLHGLTGGFEASLVVSLSFPTGTKGISSHGYDPSFQLPWSRKLSANWTAAGMLSIYVPTEDSSHRVVGETTFLVDRQLTGPWGGFVEYAGDFPESGGPRHLQHFGTSYKITAQQQIDLHAGVGLSAASVDHLVGIGYSFCFRVGK
jgi:hypothetical protein